MYILYSYVTLKYCKKSEYTLGYELIKRVFMLPSGQLYIYIFMITVIA